MEPSASTTKETRPVPVWAITALTSVCRQSNALEPSYETWERTESVFQQWQNMPTTWPADDEAAVVPLTQSEYQKIDPRGSEPYSLVAFSRDSDNISLPYLWLWKIPSLSKYICVAWNRLHAPEKADGLIDPSQPRPKNFEPVAFCYVPYDPTSNKIKQPTVSWSFQWTSVVADERPFTAPKYKFRNTQDASKALTTLLEKVIGKYNSDSIEYAFKSKALIQERLKEFKARPAWQLPAIPVSPPSPPAASAISSGRQPLSDFARSALQSIAENSKRVYVPTPAPPPPPPVGAVLPSIGIRTVERPAIELLPPAQSRLVQDLEYLLEHGSEEESSNDDTDQMISEPSAVKRRKIDDVLDVSTTEVIAGAVNIVNDINQQLLGLNDAKPQTTSWPVRFGMWTLHLRNKNIVSDNAPQKTSSRTWQRDFPFVRCTDTAKGRWGSSRTVDYEHLVVFIDASSHLTASNPYLRATPAAWIFTQVPRPPEIHVIPYEKLADTEYISRTSRSLCRFERFQSMVEALDATQGYGIPPLLQVWIDPGDFNSSAQAKVHSVQLDAFEHIDFKIGNIITKSSRGHKMSTVLLQIKQACLNEGIDYATAFMPEFIHGPLPLVMLYMALALSKLHSNGFIHGNVNLGAFTECVSNDVVWLTDFTTVCSRAVPYLRPGPGSIARAIPVGLSTDVEILKYYMKPDFKARVDVAEKTGEVLMEDLTKCDNYQPLDIHDDVWALGITFCELIGVTTGEWLQTLDAVNRLRQHVHDTPALPDWLGEVIDGMLQVNYKKRWSMKDVCKRLVRVVNQNQFQLWTFLRGQGSVSAFIGYSQDKTLESASSVLPSLPFDFGFGNNDFRAAYPPGRARIKSVSPVQSVSSSWTQTDIKTAPLWVQKIQIAAPTAIINARTGEEEVHASHIVHWIADSKIPANGNVIYIKVKTEEETCVLVFPVTGSVETNTGVPPILVQRLIAPAPSDGNLVPLEVEIDRNRTLYRELKQRQSGRIFAAKALIRALEEEKENQMRGAVAKLLKNKLLGDCKLSKVDPLASFAEWTRAYDALMPSVLKYMA